MDERLKDSNAVRSLAIHDSLLLVAYSNGLIVQFDVAKNATQCVYLAEQPIEHLEWCAPTQFATSHCDGSYVKWTLLPDAEDQGAAIPLHRSAQPPVMPYGTRLPFYSPCSLKPLCFTSFEA